MNAYDVMQLLDTTLPKPEDKRPLSFEEAALAETLMRKLAVQNERQRDSRTLGSI